MLEPSCIFVQKHSTSNNIAVRTKLYICVPTFNVLQQRCQNQDVYLYYDIQRLTIQMSELSRIFVFRHSTSNNIDVRTKMYVCVMTFNVQQYTCSNQAVCLCLYIQRLTIQLSEPSCIFVYRYSTSNNRDVRTKMYICPITSNV